ncbi:hypothetical protein [Crassaminicella profunda]|uniref:hypothetical protein n=1 Tax=Crassaminicella profunda TaxID=1286698 RepID=UPI001CA6C28A|nr:hypothetical protein [Crassaminicella profunda]QZY54163.1 hypothetical protein K7H06_14055 [Crassaminicella profunda]
MKDDYFYSVMILLVIFSIMIKPVKKIRRYRERRSILKKIFKLSNGFGGVSMVITCDASCSMGYIYLTRDPKYSYYDPKKIEKYIKKEKYKMWVEENADVNGLISNIPIKHKTYNQAIADCDITEEYLNDENEEGYLTGIELNLSKNKFIELINGKAFKLYRGLWKEKECMVTTFDITDKVFNSNNVIYPMNKNKDVYLICDVSKQWNICTIKGLISFRDDLYSYEYLMTPKFILVDKK